MIPKVAVIILNYRRPQDTLECIASVLAADTTHFSLQVMPVDNSEGFESAEALRGHYPDLPLLHNPQNLGYAEGNNVGIRQALKQGADYVFILNNDCIIEKNTLNTLIQYAQAHPDTGILAPLVCRYDDRITVDSCGTSMDWLRLRPHTVKYKTRADKNIPPVIEAQIIPGSALLISKKFLNDVGLFDTNYFLIHEDADLCLRGLEHSYQNKVVTTAVVYHKISSTFNSYPGLSIYYSIRNLLHLSGRHNPLPVKMLVFSGFLLLSLKKLALLSWRKDDRLKLRAFFLGAGDYFAGQKGACTHSI